MNGKSVRSAVVSAAFAACAAFGFTAAADSPSVFYVAPDGTGTGTSWEDAAPIGTAFAAAVEADGGEIWIKEGFYSPGGSLTVCSNLVVRGGFVGNESSADAADPKAHPTILSGMENRSWTGAIYGWSVNGSLAITEPLWKDGQFNLARPDDGDIIFRVPTMKPKGYGVAKLLTSSGAVTGLKIVGITMTGTTGANNGAAVSLPGGSDFELDGCRFLGCGCSDGAVLPGALSTGGRVTMRNCEVVGCSEAVILSGTNTSLTNLIVDCLFDDCTSGNGENVGGAILVSGKQPLVVKGCTFKNNVGAYQGNVQQGLYRPAPVLTCTATGGAIFIYDTLVEGNRIRTLGTGTPNSCVYSRSPLTVERCLFKDNSIKGETLDLSQPRAVCLFVYRAALTVRDTVFAGNTISGKTAQTAAQRWASAVHADVYNSIGKFVNCSFYGNDISLDATTDEGKAALFCGVVNVLRSNTNGDGSYGFTFVNCLFSDNKLGANVSKQADVVLDDSTHTMFTLSFINTVIWDKESDHRAYYANASYPISISHSDLVNCTVAAVTNKNEYVEYLTAVDPVVSPKPQRKCGTYPFRGMLGLDPSSLFAKAGTPIYEKNGNFYFYAPGMVKSYPWRTCHKKSSSLTTLDGATLVADGFGAARSTDAFSYGPVVNRLPGFLLMLK